MTTKKVFPFVDIAKFIFAVCIFLLHSGVLGLLPRRLVVEAISARLAVPFFFCASGFLWARKLYQLGKKKEKKEATLLYCKRLGIKLLIFEPISILILAAGRFVQGTKPAEILLTTVKEILFYPRGALWYLQAVIIGALLLLPFCISKKETRAILPAVLLYLVALFGNRYFFVVEGTAVGKLYLTYERYFLSVRNGLFVGFPFMLGGVLIARYEDAIQAYIESHKAYFGGLFAFLLLAAFCEALLIESKEGHDDNSQYFSYLLLIPTLLCLLLFGFKHHFAEGRTVLLRNLSTSIYLLHSPVQRIVEFGLLYILHNQSIWMKTGISAFAIIIICFVAYRYLPKRFSAVLK